MIFQLTTDGVVKVLSSCCRSLVFRECVVKLLMNSCECESSTFGHGREEPFTDATSITGRLAAGLVADQSLSRSSVHRLLQQNGLSQMRGSASLPEEKRSFTAEFAGSIWYGDVMHGPRVAIKGQQQEERGQTLLAVDPLGTAFQSACDSPVRRATGSNQSQ